MSGTIQATYLLLQADTLGTTKHQHEGVFSGKGLIMGIAAIVGSPVAIFLSGLVSCIIQALEKKTDSDRYSSTCEIEGERQSFRLAVSTKVRSRMLRQSQTRRAYYRWFTYPIISSNFFLMRMSKTAFETNEVFQGSCNCNLFMVTVRSYCSWRS
jgi:hypothetical protein